MKKTFISIVINCLVLLITSCNGYERQTKNILTMAGDNRMELEKVLNYFEGDSQKFKAACFLINNMPGAYGIKPEISEKYRPFYETYDSLSQLYHYLVTPEWGKQVDSLWLDFKDSSKVHISYCSDISSIKSDYLIQEINLAFEAWKGNTYSRECSFEEFCEYILPYRRFNKLSLDNSRQKYHKKHSEKYFTSQKKGWQQDVDSLLYEYRHLSHSNFWGSGIPIWDAGTFEKLRHGLCSQRCWFNSLLLSSLGMPVAIDFVPAWGNRNNSHSWNSLIINGESYAFETFWDNDRWKYKRIYNNRTKDELWGKFRLPKVYRYTYSNHIEGPLTDPETDMADVPDLFHNIKKMDVSSEYFDTEDVAVKLSQKPSEDTKFAYLAVFGYQSWNPVQWGRIKNEKVVFEKMGKDIVYLPIYYKRGIVLPAAEPFKLRSDGKVIKLTAEDKRGTLAIRLMAGSTVYSNNREYVGCMRESKIIGLYKGEPNCVLSIWRDSLPLERSYQEVNTRRPYRYVRLLLPSDSIALGELAFYTKEGKIGNIKLMTALPIKRKYETPSMMVDGLDATAYRGVIKSRIIDIDLGKEYWITQIGITPYVKTELFIPDFYELFYWKDNWVSLGRKPADNSGVLFFDNIPKGALYMLKNCSWKGKTSERIFTYDNGCIQLE